MDYGHYTHQEIIKIIPAGKLEQELQTRLECVLQRVDDLSHMEQRYELASNDKEEYQQALETLKQAIRLIATEVHRCAETGEINLTPVFIESCKDFVEMIDELVAYQSPTELPAPNKEV